MDSLTKVQITFTVEDLNNMRTFLDRADLKGAEVPAWNSIIFNIHSTLENLKKTQAIPNDTK